MESSRTQGRANVASSLKAFELHDLTTDTAAPAHTQDVRSSTDSLHTNNSPEPQVTQASRFDPLLSDAASSSIWSTLWSAIMSRNPLLMRSSPALGTGSYGAVPVPSASPGDSDEDQTKDHRTKKRRKSSPARQENINRYGELLTRSRTTSSEYQRHSRRRKSEGTEIGLGLDSKASFAMPIESPGHHDHSSGSSMLIDQGKLDAFEKVSKYWPEFATNGKENVEVRHFLSHTSGVSGWEKPMSQEDVYDLKGSTEKLAQQAPWWEPGTASGYHSLNMGHLLGELVRRVTGKSLTQFIAEEIAAPLNADFQLGAAEKDWSRTALVVPPPPLAIDFSSLPKDSPMLKTFGNPPMDATVSHTTGWRKAEIGAANGHSNARGLNRTASVVTLGGTVDGKKLLSQKTIDLIFQEQANGVDLVIGQPLRFGIGYGLPSSTGPTDWFPQGKVCFWGGWGGSIVIMDLERKVTVTYVMNKMGAGTLGNPRTQAYVKEVYKALGDATVGTASVPVV